MKNPPQLVVQLVVYSPARAQQHHSLWHSNSMLRLSFKPWPGGLRQLPPYTLSSQRRMGKWLELLLPTQGNRRQSLWPLCCRTSVGGEWCREVLEQGIWCTAGKAATHNAGLISLGPSHVYLREGESCEEAVRRLREAESCLPTQSIAGKAEPAGADCAQ